VSTAAGLPFDTTAHYQAVMCIGAEARSINKRRLDGNTVTSFAKREQNRNDLCRCAAATVRKNDTASTSQPKVRIRHARVDRSDAQCASHRNRNRSDVQAQALAADRTGRRLNEVQSR
jgi:hypothetical protein